MIYWYFRVFCCKNLLVLFEMLFLILSRVLVLTEINEVKLHNKALLNYAATSRQEASNKTLVQSHRERERLSFAFAGVKIPAVCPTVSYF